MSTKNLIYISIAGSVLFILAVSFVIQRKNLKNQTSYNRVLMGTIVEITMEEDNPAAANEAFKEIERLEKILSHYSDLSEVSLISKNAGRTSVKVSSELMEVMESALKIAQISNGAFDPTIGSLRLWNFSGEKRLPEKKEIEKLLPLVDYKMIKVDRGASTIGLAKEGMRVDLGGVAKGYIVGKALDVLKKNKVNRAIIKAGGDMAVYQDHAKEPFIIGIQHPRKKDSLLGALKVHNGYISTSGDYERFFIKDGVRYHHIIDPETGYPARKSQSVTIISQDPTLADALSTAIFVMGSEKGMKLIEDLKGVEGIIVDSEGGLFMSSGIKENFEKF